ncbi:MAG: hypothetical protein LBL30_02175 [Holosporales bacterium]|jgi:hypothetical protein|nr:hypothetical protein [Holosporales bacterium]
MNKKLLLINAAAVAFGCFSSSTVDAMRPRPGEQAAPGTLVRINENREYARIVLCLDGYFATVKKKRSIRLKNEWQQFKQSVLHPFAPLPSVELIDYLSKNCPLFKGKQKRDCVDFFVDLLEPSVRAGFEAFGYDNPDSTAITFALLTGHFPPKSYMDSPLDDSSTPMLYALMREPTLLIKAFYLLESRYQQELTGIFKGFIKGECVPVYISLEATVCAAVGIKDRLFLTSVCEKILESVLKDRGDSLQSIEYTMTISHICRRVPVVKLIHSTKALTSRELCAINVNLGQNDEDLLKQYHIFLEQIAFARPISPCDPLIAYVDEHKLIKDRSAEEAFYASYIDGVRSVHARRSGDISQQLSDFEIVLMADADTPRISWDFQFVPFRAGPAEEFKKKIAQSDPAQLNGAFSHQIPKTKRRWLASRALPLILSPFHTIPMFDFQYKSLAKPFVILFQKRLDKLYYYYYSV